MKNWDLSKVRKQSVGWGTVSDGTSVHDGRGRGGGEGEIILLPDDQLLITGVGPISN